MEVGAVLRGGEIVGLEEEEWTYELEETVERLEDDDDDPVGHADFPIQALLGIWLAAAEPTKAAAKSDNEACIVAEGMVDRVWCKKIMSKED